MAGTTCRKPFVLLCQPSLFDFTRAPEGKHTLWAYCHMPNGLRVDMTERIENQIEGFAPGFRDLNICEAFNVTVELERHNTNLIAGDITGGARARSKSSFTKQSGRI